LTFKKKIEWRMDKEESVEEEMKKQNVNGRQSCKRGAEC